MGTRSGGRLIWVKGFVGGVDIGLVGAVGFVVLRGSRMDVGRGGGRREKRGAEWASGVNDVCTVR
jgi:hypothetical protein